MLNTLKDPLDDTWKKKLRKVTDYWRWQRVFSKITVVVLTGTYWVLVDDDSGDS